jgi:hypothetical protein
MVQDITAMTRDDVVAGKNEWRVRVGVYSYFEPVEIQRDKRTPKLARRYQISTKNPTRSMQETSHRNL